MLLFQILRALLRGGNINSISVAMLDPADIDVGRVGTGAMERGGISPFGHNDVLGRSESYVKAASSENTEDMHDLGRDNEEVGIQAKRFALKCVYQKFVGLTTMRVQGPSGKFSCKGNGLTMVSGKVRISMT